MTAPDDLDREEADVRGSDLRELRGPESERRPASTMDVERIAEEVRRLRQQLAQAEKLATLGQLALGVVHEMASPLAAVAASADVARRRAAALGNPAEDLERLGRIEDAARRVLELARELVAYGRPAPDIVGSVDVGVALSKALWLSSPDTAVGVAELVQDVPAGLPRVRGVEARLVQVFVNLFTNAAHAMSSEPGTLRICAEHREAADDVVVRVEDTGCGISPEHLARVFEPFFTTKPPGCGAGLGLVVVKDLVAEAGGTVVIDSRAGGGTTVTLVLPIAR